MRIFYLIILIVLFLPMINGEVIIHDYSKPTLTLSLIAGGDLNASDEYFFRCFFQKGHIYYSSITSPTSDEYSITTNTTHRSINMSWTHWNGTHNVPGLPTIGDDYRKSLICKWDFYNMTNATTNMPFTWINYNDPNSDSIAITTGHQKWNYITEYTWSDWEGSYKEILSDDLKTDMNSRYIFHHGIGYRYDKENNWAKHIVQIDDMFNTTQGELGIEFTDPSDSWEDMVVALRSNDNYSDRYFLQGNDIEDDTNSRNKLSALTLLGTFFESYSGTDYIEVFYGKSIHLVGGNLPPGTRDDDFFYENTILNFDQAGLWYQSYSKFKDTKLLMDYGVLILNTPDIVSGFSPWKNSGTMTVYSATTYTIKGGFKIADIILNFRYPYSYNMLGTVDYTNARLLITHSRNNPTQYLYNQTFNNNDTSQTYDIYEQWYGGQTDSIIVHCVDCLSDRGNQTVQILYNDINTPIDYLNYSFEFTHNYKIIGTDGITPLNGINITEIDDNGNLYSVLTDANGQATNTVVAYTVEKNVSYDNDAKYTFNRQWNVTIDTDNYITKEIIINEFGSQERNIKLEQPPIVIEGTLIINPYNTLVIKKCSG